MGKLLTVYPFHEKPAVPASRANVFPPRAGPKRIYHREPATSPLALAKPTTIPPSCALQWNVDHKQLGIAVVFGPSCPRLDPTFHASPALRFAADAPKRSPKALLAPGSRLERFGFTPQISSPTSLPGPGSHLQSVVPGAALPLALVNLEAYGGLLWRRRERLKSEYAAAPGTGTDTTTRRTTAVHVNSTSPTPTFRPSHSPKKRLVQPHKARQAEKQKYALICAKCFAHNGLVGAGGGVGGIAIHLSCPKHKDYLWLSLSPQLRISERCGNAALSPNTPSSLHGLTSYRSAASWQHARSEQERGWVFDSAEEEQPEHKWEVRRFRHGARVWAGPEPRWKMRYVSRDRVLLRHL
ncbi:hypothetical protein B0H19DRAFT_1257001 [Mycena capillaripes]|nr:hypothetical protein B0H19DRAFT_1257001 [Mycena capillaripes]